MGLTSAAFPQGPRETEETKARRARVWTGLTGTRGFKVRVSAAVSFACDSARGSARETTCLVKEQILPFKKSWRLGVV